MKEGVVLVSILVVVLAGIIFWNDIRTTFAGSDDRTEIKMKKESSNKSRNRETSGGSVSILEKFELPGTLKEVSGIVYEGNGVFACVQDEEGTIYFYNTGSGRIERTIQFTGRGDFEDIARVNEDYYVVRADGKLFRVPGQSSAGVQEFETGLAIDDNVESLCYDEPNNRLLLMGKDENRSKGSRDVYAFQTTTSQSGKLLSINLSGDGFPRSKKGDVKFSPSAMGIHPLTREIYVTEGPTAKIYKLDSTGKLLNVFQLDSKEVPQVEGISFSEEGEIYISTEGPKKPAAIFKIELK